MNNTIQHKIMSPNAPLRTGYAATLTSQRQAVPKRQVAASEVALSTARKLVSLWGSLARDRWSLAALSRYQETRLRETLRHAYQTVPMYRELWTRNGVNPSDFHTIADLERFPILEKNLVRDRFPEGCTVAGTELSRCRIQQTSGSSGQCMEIALSLRCDDARNIYSQRIYGWNGFRWHNKTAYLFPYRLPFENNLSIYRNVFLDAMQTPDQILDRIEREHPVIFAATPSDILDLLDGMTPGRDLRRLGLQALCLHSEPLSSDERTHFESVFGCAVRTNYYCNETWAIAAECEHGTLHQFVDNVVLEIVDDAGRAVCDGEVGHALVTSLNNFVQPFIRYRLGDLIARKPNFACPCGRHFPALESVAGRDNDYFVHPDGHKVHPAKITIAVKSPTFRYPGLQIYRDYQIDQDAHDHVTIRLVAGRDREHFESCAQESIANLEKLLAPQIRVELKVTSQLQPGSGGKRKIFARSFDAARRLETRP